MILLDNCLFWESQDPAWLISACFLTFCSWGFPVQQWEFDTAFHLEQDILGFWHCQPFQFLALCYTREKTQPFLSNKLVPIYCRELQPCWQKFKLHPQISTCQHKSLLPWRQFHLLFTLRSELKHHQESHKIVFSCQLSMQDLAFQFGQHASLINYSIIIKFCHFQNTFSLIHIYSEKNTYLYIYFIAKEVELKYSMFKVFLLIYFSYLGFIFSILSLVFTVEYTMYFVRIVLRLSEKYGL